MTSAKRWIMISVKRWTREDMDNSVEVLPDDAKWVSEQDYDALYNEHMELDRLVQNLCASDAGIAKRVEEMTDSGLWEEEPWAKKQE